MTPPSAPLTPERVRELAFPMTIGSLFSGIGGLELGLEWAGLGPVLWQCERDDFCRSVLSRNWPMVKRYDDVTTLHGTDLTRVQLLCGGFPCQDNSSAQRSRNRLGLAGARSGLWGEFARLTRELEPEFVVVENVASGAHLWVTEVVRELEKQGYDCLSIPLSAADVGGPHGRSRIFVIARHADAHCESMVPVDEKMARLSRSTRRFPGWSERPDLRVADGFSAGMAALGNAVVPQCAEVIGWVIRELAADRERRK